MNKLEQAAQALLDHWDTPAWKYLKPTGDLMADLREALAEQAEQEPVAWHHPECDGQCIACLIEKAVTDAYGTQGRAYMLRHINAAPVRTKNLTDDEIRGLFKLAYPKSFVLDCDITLARSIIAADREKNK